MTTVVELRTFAAPTAGQVVPVTGYNASDTDGKGAGSFTFRSGTPPANASNALFNSGADGVIILRTGGGYFEAVTTAGVNFRWYGTYKAFTTGGSTIEADARPGLNALIAADKIAQARGVKLKIPPGTLAADDTLYPYADGSGTNSKLAVIPVHTDWEGENVKIDYYARGYGMSYGPMISNFHRRMRLGRVPTYNASADGDYQPFFLKPAKKGATELEAYTTIPSATKTMLAGGGYIWVGFGKDQVDSDDNLWAQLAIVHVTSIVGEKMNIGDAGGLPFATDMRTNVGPVTPGTLETVCTPTNGSHAIAKDEHFWWEEPEPADTLNSLRALYYKALSAITINQVEPTTAQAIVLMKDIANDYAGNFPSNQDFNFTAQVVPYIAKDITVHGIWVNVKPTSANPTRGAAAPCCVRGGCYNCGFEDIKVSGTVQNTIGAIQEASWRSFMKRFESSGADTPNNDAQGGRAIGAYLSKGMIIEDLEVDSYFYLEGSCSGEMTRVKLIRGPHQSEGSTTDPNASSGAVRNWGVNYDRAAFKLNACDIRDYPQPFRFNTYSGQTLLPPQNNIYEGAEINDCVFYCIDDKTIRIANGFYNPFDVVHGTMIIKTPQGDVDGVLRSTRWRQEVQPGIAAGTTGTVQAALPQQNVGDLSDGPSYFLGARFQWLNPEASPAELKCWVMYKRNVEPLGTVPGDGVQRPHARLSALTPWACNLQGSGASSRFRKSLRDDMPVLTVDTSTLAAVASVDVELYWIN